MAYSPGLTVGALLSVLQHKYPPLGQLMPAVKVAVNEEFASLDRILSDGDVVALIPPVAGCADGLFAVRDEPLSLDEVVRAVSSEELGGIATFTGVVRRQSRGQRVVRLEYEAYRPMAERTLREIGAQLMMEQPGVRLAIVHRVGVLAVG
ncbi:MAG TPA: molybdenum cofactor biosynthesis protein MoaE, partial [Polyangia bacterium]|nr:molybdenum cofactor biosynthesis protein MoaE [Polyangia bacterium]